MTKQLVDDVELDAYVLGLRGSYASDDTYVERLAKVICIGLTDADARARWLDEFASATDCYRFSADVEDRIAWRFATWLISNYRMTAGRSRLVILREAAKIAAEIANGATPDAIDYSKFMQYASRLDMTSVLSSAVAAKLIIESAPTHGVNAIDIVDRVDSAKIDKYALGVVTMAARRDAAAQAALYARMARKLISMINND